MTRAVRPDGRSSRRREARPSGTLAGDRGPCRTAVRAMAALEPLFRALGHRVHPRDDVDWIEVGMFSMMAVPSTATVTAPAGAITDLLRQSGRIATTFVADDGRVPAMAFWVRDPDYGAQSVQRQFRQNLRRGTARVGVRPLDWQEFARLGRPVHVDVAASRGGRLPASTEPSGWDRLCEAAAATPGLGAIGCFVERSLAGFILSRTARGICEGLVATVSPRFGDARPAHALYHGFAAEMIRRPGVHGVTVGRSSLPRNASLDAFKRHAGYVPEPIRVGVVLHPRWRWLAAPVVRGGLHVARRLTGGRVVALGNVALLDAAAGEVDRPGAA